MYTHNIEAEFQKLCSALHSGDLIKYHTLQSIPSTAGNNPKHIAGSFP